MASCGGLDVILARSAELRALRRVTEEDEGCERPCLSRSGIDAFAAQPRWSSSSSPMSAGAASRGSYPGARRACSIVRKRPRVSEFRAAIDAVALMETAFGTGSLHWPELGGDGWP